MLNNDTTRPKCGEIWMCELRDGDGSIQTGYRPVFVLSNDKNNKHSTTVNVAPITGKRNKHYLPVHVEIKNYFECGLNMPSILLVEQITTVPQVNFTKCIGKICDVAVLKEVWNAINIQFPLMQQFA